MMRRLEAENRRASISPNSIELCDDLIEEVHKASPTSLTRSKCLSIFNDKLRRLADSRPARERAFTKKKKEAILTARIAQVVAEFQEEERKQRIGAAAKARRAAIAAKPSKQPKKDPIMVGKRAA